MPAILDRLAQLPRERQARLVDAAVYGSVVMLAALAVVDPEEVEDGWGLELVVAVGVATWIAHFFAELVADQIRHAHLPDRGARIRDLSNGTPVILATLLPAVAIGLGRFDAVEADTAIWAAIGLALVQLFCVFLVVGSVSRDRRGTWLYALATTALGLVVVAIKIALGH